MPICPKCKNEYVEGITECADCKCPLVDTLEETDSRPIMFGEQIQMERLAEFLKYNGLKTVNLKESNDAKDTFGNFLWELYIGGQEEMQAKKATAVFLQEEAKAAKAAAADLFETESEPEPAQRSVGVYHNSEEQSKEFRSSATVLLGVGSVGFIACILILFDVIDLNLTASSKYMSTGVMGALFVLFIVMGILSLRSSKKLETKAASENMLTEELTAWCMSNLTKENIDAELTDAETSEEELYFKRTAVMKERITTQFVNLEESYLDNFIEERYPVIFEQDET